MLKMRKNSPTSISNVKKFPGVLPPDPLRGREGKRRGGEGRGGERRREERTSALTFLGPATFQFIIT
jgi:hypothetical protein